MRATCGCFRNNSCSQPKVPNTQSEEGKVYESPIKQTMTFRADSITHTHWGRRGGWMEGRWRIRECICAHLVIYCSHLHLLPPPPSTTPPPSRSPVCELQSISTTQHDLQLPLMSPTQHAHLFVSTRPSRTLHCVTQWDSKTDISEWDATEDTVQYPAQLLYNRQCTAIDFFFLALQWRDLGTNM